MANGDKAAAAGMDTVPLTADKRQGYDEINKTRDYVAQQKTDTAAALAGKQANLGFAPVRNDYAGVVAFTWQGSLKVTVDVTTMDVPTGPVVRPGDGIDTGGNQIRSAGARNTPVTSNYVAAYINGDGRFGASASSVEYKQDIQPADTTGLVDALLHAALVRFRYIGAVDELGDDAQLELGAIAEYFDTAGLSEYVFRHEDGTPMGISYERLTIPLIAVVQSLAARIEALEARP